MIQSNPTFPRQIVHTIATTNKTTYNNPSLKQKPNITTTLNTLRNYFVNDRTNYNNMTYSKSLTPNNTNAITNNSPTTSTKSKTTILIQKTKQAATKKLKKLNKKQYDNNQHPILSLILQNYTTTTILIPIKNITNPYTMSSFSRIFFCLPI